MVLENVVFEVSGRVVLHPLSMTLSGSGITGLIGQNGSGKSTLLKLLARQESPTAGHISFEGKPLPNWTEREFAQKVAYLPQHTPIAAGLKVRELVALGRYPWHGAFGRFSDMDQKKVDEAMFLTSTAPLAERFVDTLSGGERQRVWLAMLLAQDARLLLLDEPLSALDVAHQVEVLRLIHRLSLEKRIAVIIILHEINLAAHFCDTILALKDGRLIVNGTPDQFMTTQQLEKIYEIEMGLLPNPDTGEVIAYVRKSKYSNTQFD